MTNFKTGDKVKVWYPSQENSKKKGIYLAEFNGRYWVLHRNGRARAYSL